MKAGDHIQFTREGVAEHAIDLGDRTVLHFAEGAGVRRVPLAQVACGARVEVVTHRERVYAPRLVVARAFSRLADSALAGMFHDSEEFATWCKTGRPPVRPLAASSVAAPLGVARSPARPARQEPKPNRTARPASKRPPARKTGKPARTAKRAGAAAARPAAKRAAPRRPAGAVKKAAKARPAAKAARAAAPAPKRLKAPPSRRPLAAASPARPVKSAKRPPAPKPKRGKTPGKRAAAGR